MVLAMHQPQYLPWLGYIHKIYSCDCFVLLDCVQYEKGGFQNRNKIRTKRGAPWLSVPVVTKGASKQKLKDVAIDNSKDWQKSHWGLIQENYKTAGFFQEHAAFFKQIFAKRWERLVDLNLEILFYILTQLKIEKNIILESSLNVSSSATERILDICSLLSADTYLSGAGASSYLDEQEFKETNTKLIYQNFIHPAYAQVFSPFIPFMSVIDLLFNCGPQSLQILRSGK